jgi:epoxyqueuosine reductase QueG
MTTKLHDHPTVQALRLHPSAAPRRLSLAELRTLALECGAEDVGFVEIERPELADQRADITRALPGTTLLISYVVRMNRAAIRTPERASANLEFHHVGDLVNAVGHRLARALQDAGHRALNPAMGFPMEMDRFGGKAWTVSHKPVAVAAGLGRIGVHRNVIHPRFGSFVLLGTLLCDIPIADADRDALGRPLDWNPCFECKLCVAACPVGAIKQDGGFDFSACYTHNYREFMGGFSDLLGHVAESRDREQLRERVGDSELVSWWQSLAFGPTYKAAYCLAVCPAGSEVIAPFLSDRKHFVEQVVRPLQGKVETLYVLPGSDAEAHAKRRFPHKPTRRVSNGLRPRSIEAFLRGLPLAFQRDQAAEVELRVHFVFRPDEGEGDPIVATVAIDHGRLEVVRELVGGANLRVEATHATWLGLLAGRRSPLGAMLARKLRIHGAPRLLTRFRACFR